MPLNITEDTIENNIVRFFEDGSGTVIAEDKTNGNQVALDDDVTMADVASHLSADSNPHTTTLEQARSADNQLAGPVDAGGNDVTNVGALGTEQLNNNEVNLTKLVNDGAYADMGDAIANEPPTNPVGTSHIIEPGTYQINTQYEIGYSSRKIVCPGHGALFNTNGQGATLEWTGGDTTPMFVTPTGAKSLGIKWHNIKFRPAADGDGDSAFYFRGTGGGSVNAGWIFSNCVIADFGGPGLKVEDFLRTFALHFTRSSLYRNSGKVQMGVQARAYYCHFVPGNGDSPGFRFGSKSTVHGAELITGDIDTVGFQASELSTFHFANAEGDRTAGEKAVVVDAATASQPTLIYGHIAGMDIAIDAIKGAITVFASFANTQSYKVQFDNSNANRHNGSFLVGNYAPSDIRGADRRNSIVIFTASHFNNAASLPTGMFGFEKDRGGTGNQALLRGEVEGDFETRYWDADGAL